MSKEIPEKDIAMQVKCIYCGKEQYTPAVFPISHSKQGCVWCGNTPPILTESQYMEKMRTLIQSGGDV